MTDAVIDAPYTLDFADIAQVISHIVDQRQGRHVPHDNDDVLEMEYETEIVGVPLTVSFVMPSLWFLRSTNWLVSFHFNADHYLDEEHYRLQEPNAAKMGGSWGLTRKRIFYGLHDEYLRDMTAIKLALPTTEPEARVRLGFGTMGSPRA